MVTAEGAGRWSLPTPFIDSEQTLTIVSLDLCAYAYMCVCLHVVHLSSPNQYSSARSTALTSKPQDHPLTASAYVDHTHRIAQSSDFDPRMFNPADPYTTSAYGNLTPSLRT